MKHIILTTITIIAALTSCNKKCDEYGLNCKVKSVLEQSYSAKQKFGEIDRDICINLELLEFNNDRQMTSKSMFYYFGFKPGDDLELREKVIYKYNDQGLMVQMDEYDKDGDFTGKEVYEYNDQGLQTDEYSYDSDGKLWSHEHMEYNEFGKPLSELYTYNDESHKWEYIYNENNDCIAAIHYDNDGKEDRRSEFTYNNHHLISETNYEDGEIWCQSELTWDGDKLIKYKHSLSNGKVIEENNPIPLSTNKNGLPINAEHDDWGSVTYEYVTFDKKGNWTKRYAHDPKTNEVKYITEREITY